MFVYVGQPEDLTSIRSNSRDLSTLKKLTSIAVVDDEKFQRADQLKTNGFNLIELGGDIASIDVVSAHPIVVCDIRGVGQKFGSKYEGAHVLAELRKAFPDKYLIAFTGMQFDASYNQHLTAADVSLTKDASTDIWVKALEDGIACVNDPIVRWKRFRKSLLDRDVALFHILRLEQAYIKAVKSKDDSLFKTSSVMQSLTPEIKELVSKFAVAGASQIIEKLVSS